MARARIGANWHMAGNPPSGGKGAARGHAHRRLPRRLHALSRKQGLHRLRRGRLAHRRGRLRALHVYCAPALPGWGQAACIRIRRARLHR